MHNFRKLKYVLPLKIEKNILCIFTYTLHYISIKDVFIVYEDDIWTIFIVSLYTKKFNNFDSDIEDVPGYTDKFMSLLLFVYKQTPAIVTYYL